MTKNGTELHQVRSGSRTEDGEETDNEERPDERKGYIYHAAVRGSNDSGKCTAAVL